MENPFWDYSLAHYRRDDVEAVCLQLQDECGLDVNLLLYAAWLAGQSQLLTLQHLEAVVAATRQWRAEVVVPLRQLRRRLKTVPGAEALRAQLATLELTAEQQQQALAFACHQAADLPQDSAASLGANLRLVAQRTGSNEQVWQPLVARLETALAQ